MNLLGMKRKLLPYGMPLGGAGGAVGSAMGSMGSASSGGGKSSAPPQNAYGSSYQAPAANVYQPSYQGQPAPSSGGGKSSGLGQGGYGMAPGFGGQPQPGMMAPRSGQFRTKEQEAALDQQGGMGGQFGTTGGFGGDLGASTRLGGMGAAADKRAMLGGFGPQAPDTSQERYNQMMAVSNFRGGAAPSYEQWKQQTENPFSGIKGMGGFGQQIGTLAQPANNFGQFGAQTNPLPPPGFENMANNPEFNLRLQGSSGGAQMQAPTKEGYDFQMSKGLFPPGTTYEQWAQSQNDKAAEQRAGAEAFSKYREQQFSQQRPGQQPSQMSGMDQMGFGGMGGQQVQQPRSSPFQQQFGSMGGGFGRMPQQQFNPYQQQFNPFQQQFSPFQQQFGRFQPPQQQFNPFQQQFGGFQQQPQNISGLQGLFNQMMGQQQMPMQRQPMQQYQDPALQYRPNMQNAQSALSRVRPSVQRQQQDAQSARIAELEAQLARFNTPSGE